MEMKVILLELTLNLKIWSGLYTLYNDIKKGPPFVLQWGAIPKL